MFRPNLDCRVQLSAGTDVFGQAKPAIFRKERCAIVKLVLTAVKTPVRADSSASRGTAEEIQAVSVILLESTTKVKIGDLIEVVGVTLNVSGRFPRHDVNGRLDHYEINATVWSAA